VNNKLPFLFLDRIKSIIPDSELKAVMRQFSLPGPLSVRINSLKIGREELIRILRDRNIRFEKIAWFDYAMILKDITQHELGHTDLIKEGFLYSQSLSSMLPVLVLNPKPGERVLDMCAAPGSKTTQMAALMRNEGQITAIDAIRSRYYRLKAVSTLLGVKNVLFRQMDARRFRARGKLFDKVLVDAPCSTEGRFKEYLPKTYSYWSRRKIKEMVSKQRGLVLNAGRLLREGGELVYSTCSFAPEENEGVIDWVLKKSEGALSTVPVKLDSTKSYPALLRWQKKVYNDQVGNCFRVLPDQNMEGFFIAKLKKNGSAFNRPHYRKNN